MSKEKISFLTSDLAVALGLPRTTVNDWLTRYAVYLEYDMRGKRRVYTLRSLEVLQFVAQLRAQGMSAPEVEKQLAERYGLRPEVAPDEPPPPPGSAEPGTQLASMVRSTGVMLRRNNEEMDRLFGAVEELAFRQRRSLRNFYWTLLLVMLAGLLALLPLIFFGSRLIRRYEAERRESVRRVAEHQQAESELAAAVAALRSESRLAAEAEREARAAERREMGEQLDRTRADYREQVAELRREMAAEKERADAEIARMRADAEERHAAETAQLRRDFAARQLELQQALEAERARAAEQERRLEDEAARREVLEQTLEAERARAAAPREPVPAAPEAQP